MTQRGLRGLGVLPQEPDEIDQNERINVTFGKPYCISYVEVRSLYAFGDNTPNPPEEARVAFILGETTTTQDLVGTGTNGADEGVASYSPASPIKVNSMSFYSPDPTDINNEFAVAGFTVYPFQFDYES
jgi:hypothetical protein